MQLENVSVSYSIYFFSCICHGLHVFHLFTYIIPADFCEEKILRHLFYTSVGPVSYLFRVKSNLLGSEINGAPTPPSVYPACV